jgi:hypothetical protein
MKECCLCSSTAKILESQLLISQKLQLIVVYVSPSNPLCITVLDTTIVLSFFATSVLAQDAPYSEEYMKQHDGGDRAEYL